jgi:hypothetical protein
MATNSTTTAATATSHGFFNVVEAKDGSLSVEVEEGKGNAFHLGPILRKYTSARLNVKGARSTTLVEFSLLYEALGLLRSLQYDVASFNSVSDSTQSATSATNSHVRYACYRLTRQAAAFGVRVPRPGSGTVEVPGLNELVEFVETTFADQITRARILLAGGLVDFAALAEMYRPGTDLVDRGACTGLFGVPTGMRVRACFVSRGKSLFGTVSTFFAALEFVVAVGERFAVVEHQFPISDFPGTRSCTEGMETFVSMSDALKTELRQRGDLYVNMSTRSSFFEYAAGSFMPILKGGTSRTPSRCRGGGRIMVDSRAAWARGVHCARSEGTASDAVKGVLKLVAQRTRTSATLGMAADVISAGGQVVASDEESSLELLLLPAPLPESLVWLSWPVVAGFSFQAKSWGVAMVSGLQPVVFNDQAFSRLVLPPERKRLIEALVLSHTGKKTAVDIIAGKGEGTIFLLHGPPGVGKTLTAEAIAELLHRPLYCVSMGELGTTPDILEERLLDILDMCTPWGALVLIDEAEMLLERRTKNDIVRNAMVCVMLRLLEYYTGILFLTTNRVQSLDPAFQSRVQCALRYDALDAPARARVWADLMSHAPDLEVAADVDMDALAVHALNGRQIKNALQLGIALARHEGVPMSMRHLDATLDLTTAFLAEGASSSWD